MGGGGGVQGERSEREGHFIWGFFMVSDIWWWTTRIARQETGWQYVMVYSFRAAARTLLYAPIDIQDSTYYGFCYTRRWVLAALSYFSFQPVLHDWCNKGRGMCYPVCGMVHIKEPLLLIDKSSLCGGSGFPFSLSEWSLTICLTPYNRR